MSMRQEEIITEFFEYRLWLFKLVVFKGCSITFIGP